MPALGAALGAGGCGRGSSGWVGAGLGAVLGAAGVPCALRAAWHMPAARRDGSSASELPRDTSLAYTGDLSEMVICILSIANFCRCTKLSIANTFCQQLFLHSE